MKSRAVKTGRPNKISAKDKEQIILNYFLFEVQGSSERMSVRNIYALLSAYANKNGYESCPYDFSRYDEVKKYIASLVLPQNQNSSIIPVYIPLDIKDLMYKTPEKMMRILIDREEYFQNLHTRAARALEELKSLMDQISTMKDTQEKLTQKVQEFSSINEKLKEQDIGLNKENRYLKAYIKRTIEPSLAEIILTGQMADELSSEALELVSPRGKEPAVIPISNYIKNDFNEETGQITAKSILSKLKKEHE